MSQDLGSPAVLFCADADCVNAFLREVMELYRLSLYRYNSMVKRFGVYLKPLHVVVKKGPSGVKTYYYYGRYWYRVEYRNGRLRWLYVSKEKPLPELPNPPVNPFTVIKVVNKEDGASCIYVDSIYDLKEQIQHIKEAMNKVNCLRSGSPQSATKWYHG